MGYRLFIKIKCLFFLLVSLCASEPPHEEKFPSLRKLIIKRMARILVEKSGPDANLLFNKPIEPASGFITWFKEQLSIELPIYKDTMPFLNIACAEKIVENLKKEVSSKDYNIEKRLLLHHCAQRQKEWYTQLLLELQLISVDTCDIKGNSALHDAVMQNHVPTVTVLLSHGANMKICNKLWDLPVHIAINNNYLNLLELLISNDKTLLQYTDKNGFGLLHYVAFNPKAFKALQYLLSLQINIDAVIILGKPPYISLQSRIIDLQ